MSGLTAVIIAVFAELQVRRSVANEGDAMLWAMALIAMVQGPTYKEAGEIGAVWTDCVKSQAARIDDDRETVSLIVQSAFELCKEKRAAYWSVMHDLYEQRIKQPDPIERATRFVDEQERELGVAARAAVLEQRATRRGK